MRGTWPVVPAYAAGAPLLGGRVHSAKYQTTAVTERCMRPHADSFSNYKKHFVCTERGGKFRRRLKHCSGVVPHTAPFRFFQRHAERITNYGK